MKTWTQMLATHNDTVRRRRKALDGGVALLLATIWVLCWAPGLHAQGSRKDDVVFNAQGRPMAGATVRICASSATGQPCTPLANIYSDAAMTQALANPMSTDGLGNYSFYAAPGRYMVEISGPGITTKQIPDVILPNDPSAPTFASLTTTSGISAFSLSLSGNLTVTGNTAVTGSLTAGGSPVATTSLPNTWTATQTFNSPVMLGSTALQGGNAAAKSDATLNARFASANGNDTNDGLSVGSSKQTIYSALTDLTNNPGMLGEAGGLITLSQSNSDNGLVFAIPQGTLYPGQSGQATVRGGIWIMGPGDPNFCTVTNIARASNVVTVTCSSGVPASPYYAIGHYISVFSVSDATFDGSFAITSVSGSTFTYNQTGSDSSVSGGKGAVVPLGWIPENNRGFDFRGMAGASSSGTGGSEPNVSIVGGQQWNPVNVTAISESGNTVTAVMSGGTWFAGAPIFVTGVQAGATCTNGICTGGYNGYYIIATVSGGTTITYTVSSAGLAADSTGAIQQELPSIWLSSVSGAIFRDISVAGPLPLLIGVDSNMALEGTDVQSDLHFIDCTFSVSTGGGNSLSGPATWIGSNSLWVYFDNSMWQANPTAPVISDQRAALLMKSLPGGATSGLVKVWHGNSAGGGGFRWYQQAGSSSAVIDGWLEEGAGQSQPVFEIMSNTGSLAADIRDIGIADSGDKPPYIRVPQGFAYGAGEVIYHSAIGELPARVQGPVTVINDMATAQVNAGNSTTAPLVSQQAQGQQGFTSGHLVNLQTNAARRAFAPSAVRFQNLAAQAPSGWSSNAGTGVSITSGIADPTGNNGAGKVSCAANVGGVCSVKAYNASHSFAIGDYVVAEVWVQSADHSAGASLNMALTLSGTLPTAGAFYKSNASGGPFSVAPLSDDDGAWQRVFLWAKAASSSSGTVTLLLQFDATHPMNFYAPALYFLAGNQVAAPSAPSVSQAAGGSLAATTYYVRTSYVSATGETNTQSSDTTFNASSSNVITVASPGASAGATGWNVYVGNAASCPGAGQGALTGPGETCEVKQNATPIAIGTNWTESTGGLFSFSSWYAGANGPAGQTQPVNDTTNTYGDSEIADAALNLTTFAASCSVGQTCTPSGPIAGGAFSTKSSAYTLAVTDSWVNVTGTTTVTLPHAIVGQRWVVFNSGSNTVTLQADSGNINGSANITLSANTGKEITCDGSNCFAH